ncbi:MAG TPA: 2-C-methyl-D-erythritol 4-phosphate cytidylyltransferase [Actinomycetota bacterium]|nr:2-C-methyl-D-erythritol 4-phosphate cytidylyltransferase [Actinomycetota bacterium]
MNRAVAIVLAGGAGERLGERTPKAFVPLGGRPMLVHAATAALACPAVGSIVVAAPEGFEDLAHATLEGVGAHAVVTGGGTRQASVRAALEAVPAEAGAIVCHDAARPFARPELFAAVLEALAEADGAVPVLPVPDTVKRVRGGLVLRTEPREELALAQTPQAFRAPALREAHRRAAEAGIDLTDDAAVLEWAGFRVRAVPGDPGNFKITTPDDLARAELHAGELARG